MRHRGAARVLVALACAALPLAGACGKKGPPLAPLARLPVAPSQVSASRAGDLVAIRFTVPGANVSGVQPADIARVEVYAWTGPDVPAARVFKVATMVASVPVRPPPPPQDPEEDPAVRPPPPVGPGVDQGAATELRETLTDQAFEPIELLESKKTPPSIREPKVTPPDAVPVPAPLTRRYVVVGVNRGGRRGPPAAPVAVPLWTAPPPPAGVTAKAVETGTELTWTAPATLRRPVMLNALPPAPRAAPPASPGAAARAPVARPPADAAPADDDDVTADDDDVQTAPPSLPTADGERPAPAGERPGVSGKGTPAEGKEGQGLLPARPAVPWPAVTSGYHVYDAPPAGAAAALSQPGGPHPPPQTRLTTAPVNATTFSDTRVEHGRERCYVVRTVETIGTLSLESEGSTPACVKTADVFPPAPPRSLAAVSSEGAISLIWEGSAAPDVAGYVVLRGIAPGAPAERLTPQPIRETTFRDTSVKPGTRYVYAVVAVDTAVPPNASPPSNQIQETAR